MENTLDIILDSHNITDLIGTDSGLVFNACRQIYSDRCRLQKKGIYFRHVESDVNKILGEFCTNMGIDGNLYQIRIHVIFETLMQHELLI